MTSPTNILSIAALILLLGTVGVLVVCRLALAALLIIGPVFIVLALFEGTRGLFEGWLKSVAMFAFVPLLTVVMGSGALVAIAPMVPGLTEAARRSRSAPPFRSWSQSIIYMSLMLLVLKVAANLTRGWRLQAAARSRCPVLPLASPADIRNVRWRRRRHLPLRPRDISRTVFETRSRASRRRRPAIAFRPRCYAVINARLRQAGGLLPDLGWARSQLRYLHHRVAGAPNNPLSREMLR